MRNYKFVNHGNELPFSELKEWGSPFHIDCSLDVFRKEIDMVVIEMEMVIKMSELLSNFNTNYFQIHPARNYGRIRMINDYLNCYLSDKVSCGLQV